MKCVTFKHTSYKRCFWVLWGVLAPTLAYAQSQNDVTWRTPSGGGVVARESQSTKVPAVAVPRLLSYQAKIVQGDLPILEGKIDNLTVVYALSPPCKEEFKDVRVLDSVINLELGHGAHCAIDRFLKSSTLSIKLCLSVANSIPELTNCFEPTNYNIGSAPAAVKSTLALQSEISYMSNSSIEIWSILFKT